MNTQEQEKAVPKVVVKRIINAPREKVFQAWTDPKLMEQWFHPPTWRAESRNELRVGGTYHHDMIADGSGSGCSSAPEVGRVKGERYLHSGEYLEITPPERLVFTWNTPFVQNSRVTVELRKHGTGTEITLTHEFLETEELRAQHTEGWGTCLDQIVLLLEAKE